MREKGERVRVLSEGRKGRGRILIQTESVNTVRGLSSETSLKFSIAKSVHLLKNYNVIFGRYIHQLQKKYKNFFLSFHGRTQQHAKHVIKNVNAPHRYSYKIYCRIFVFANAKKQCFDCERSLYQNLSSLT